EDGLDVDLPRERAQRSVSDDEVEEAPLTVRPRVTLVTQVVVRPGDGPADHAGPAAVVRLSVRLPAEEDDDLRVDAGVGVLGRILLADPELEVAVPVVWL